MTGDPSLDREVDTSGRIGEKEKLKESLSRTLRHVRKRITRPQYESWFRNLALRRCDDGLAEFVVANSFAREYVLARYGTILQDAVHEAIGPEVRAVVQCEPDLWSACRTSPSVTGPAAPAPNEVVGPESEPSGDLALNPAYTFENFVTSSVNRLPQAASLAVAEHRGGQYNPLFLHGGVGLGKTHLLQAVCHLVLRNDPRCRVRYLSCEAFTNEYIAALGAGKVNEFRQWYRNLDYLVLDDVHFLSNKERTQDEFFHTFNALYNAQKQIVLTSDCPPSEIPALKERLVSRFRWGMVVEVPPPDFETRVAIVMKKARLWGTELDVEVARLVAEKVTSNVRELEGATVKVIGHASLAQRAPDRELAESVLDRIQPAKPRSIGLETILEAVCSAFQVKPSEVRGRRRVRTIAVPRHVCMYLARELTHASLEEIGGFFGGRDHSTVLYAASRMHRQLEENPSLRERVSILRETLR